MKLKHIISKFNSSYYTALYKQIQSVSCEKEDKWKLTARIGDKKYNDSRREYLLKVLEHHITETNDLIRGWKFTYMSRILGCNITVYVQSNYTTWCDYYRCTEIEFDARVINECNENEILWNILYKLNWNSSTKIKLDREDNQESIKQKIEAKLSEYFYHHASVFGNIQLYHTCLSKDEVKKWYKIYLDRQKQEISVKYNHDEVRRAIERRFNVEIWVDNLVKVGNMLAKDGIKYKQTKRIEKYDHSWIFSFDGDVDEIEQEFYETMEDNVIYI